MINHKMMDNLGTRVARSGAWVFGMRFVHQVFYLGRLIILARMLAPKDFGLMGIALLTMMTLENFSQTGFQEALIQKKKNIRDYLDAAWTVSIFRGIILFTLIILIAPFVAKFFETPEAEKVVQAIGLAVLIQSFTNVGIVYFKKELEFNKQFIFITLGTAADFLVAVTVAILMKSVWALLFGLLAGRLIQAIASYIIVSYKPKISFDFHKAKELFGFGKWVLGSSVLAFLITQGDDFFVGKFLGATMLGFYQVAYKISNTPATEITHLISQVTFPAYSKLQDNINKLRKSYLNVLKVIAFLSFPIAGFIFLFANELTLILLGEKWMPIVPVVQVLVFAGFFRSFALTAGPVFYGLGKPKLDTLWQVVRLIILIVLIYPLTLKLDLVGTSLAVLGSIFVANIGFVLGANKLTKTSVQDFLKAIYIPFFATVTVMILVVGLKDLIGGGIFESILIILISGLLYVFLIFISVRFFNYQIWDLFKEKILPALKSS